MSRKKKNSEPSEQNNISVNLALRTRKRVVLDFPPSVLQTPITYILAKEYDVISNILRAQISPEESGKLVLEIDGLPENLENAINLWSYMLFNLCKGCADLGAAFKLAPGALPTQPINVPTVDPDPTHPFSVKIDTL